MHFGSPVVPLVIASMAIVARGSSLGRERAGTSSLLVEPPSSAVEGASFGRSFSSHPGPTRTASGLNCSGSAPLNAGLSSGIVGVGRSIRVCVCVCVCVCYANADVFVCNDLKDMNPPQTMADTLAQLTL